jgi:hypothetical protein
MDSFCHLMQLSKPAACLIRRNTQSRQEPME